MVVLVDGSVTARQRGKQERASKRVKSLGVSDHVSHGTQSQLSRSDSHVPAHTPR